jgi:Uma2 family endonuclease
MNAVFTPTRLRVTTERYQKMVATEVLTKHDRVELIDGEILEMAPIGRKHSAITARLHERFVLAVTPSATVIGGGAVNLGAYSMPQPDLILLKRREDFYGERLPEVADILLLVEISDSSLAFDQSTKLELYARSGVAEYWVIDVDGRRIVKYLQPRESGYASKLEFTGEESVSPQAFPNLQLLVKEILE